MPLKAKFHLSTQSFPPQDFAIDSVISGISSNLSRQIQDIFQGFALSILLPLEMTACCHEVSFNIPFIGLIARFSSDVDFAILGEGLSQNQQKKLVARIGHESTAGMEEVEKPDTVKNNRFRKTYHIYKSVIGGINRGASNVMSNQVIVEINTYGNPYPYERREIKPFITEMMKRRGLNDMIADLDMNRPI